MSIPCKMRPAGLESLPMGYTRLEFLESTGKQYINIDYALYPDSEVAIVAEEHALTVSFSGGLIGANYNKNLYAIWVGADGTRWDWYGRAVHGKKIPVGQKAKLEKKGRFNFVDGVETIANQILANPPEWEITDRCALFASSPPHFPASAFEGAIYSAKIGRGGVLGRSFVPALDTVGRPCMFDLVSKQPFYNARAGSEFIAGLTMGQARNLAYLPAPTTINTLTISLPKEARLVLYNQDVNAAIAAAEAKGWTIDVQYRDTFDDEAIRDKYAACVTRRDIININPEYYLDLTSAGEWIYPLPELTYPGQMWQGHPELKAWLVDMPKVTNLEDWCFGCGGLEYIEMDFSHVTNMGRCFCCPLKSIPEGFNPQTRHFELLLAGSLLGDDGLVEFNEVVNEAVYGRKMLAVWGGEGQKFQLDPRYTFEHLVNGNACFAANGGTVGGYYGEIRLNLLSLEDATDMFYASTDIYHFESPLPKLRTAKGMFGPDYRGRSFSLDKTSALSVCNNIPQWEDGELHELTIGIYEGYKTDQDVLDALALAEEKGWTLTVQWGKVAPPEWTQAQAQATTTYSMRRQQPVYAKLGEPTEWPDGTIRPVLDWGHYVTNWEENGYQEFASLEEAYEHFNLEMPATEESDAS